MPDYFWTAMVCGSFSRVWGFLRTRLVFQALRMAASPQSPPEQHVKGKQG
jgi:hypothetical protein